MGNCQAVDAATVVIQHPGGARTELAYWALPAGEVMAANPGHYVAAVITVPQLTTPAAAASNKGGATRTAPAPPPVKHLKLLRPDDTLQLGRVYRLVSFEEVLKEFATKRHVKLSRVMVKAKDEAEVAKKPAKARRRRSSTSGAAEREESDRSLAKVMRQSNDDEEEDEPAAAMSPVPTPGTDDDRGDATGAVDNEDDDCDLESLLPGLALGRRIGRQWKPALQSIEEGRD